MEHREFSESELRDAARRVTDVYVRQANKMFRTDIPDPLPLKFTLCEHPKFHKATGIASPEMHINLNMVLFKENWDGVVEILNETIQHEVGHLVAFRLFGARGIAIDDHGYEWQEIMRRLGKLPTKKHKLNVRPAVAWYRAFKKQKKKQEKELGGSLQLAL